MHQRASIVPSCNFKVPYSIVQKIRIQELCAIFTGLGEKRALCLQYGWVVFHKFRQSGPQRVCLLTHAH